jgi:hypothetical protein
MGLYGLYTGHMGHSYIYTLIAATTHLARRCCAAHLPRLLCVAAQPSPRDAAASASSTASLLALDTTEPSEEGREET